jgi:hypothetical protein
MVVFETNFSELLDFLSGAVKENRTARRETLTTTLGAFWWAYELCPTLCPQLNSEFILPNLISTSTIKHNTTFGLVLLSQFC